jgi:hypothetical protein
MRGMYAMRRANGDWFAFEEHGLLRVPVFSSSHAAMQARAYNWGMLLFKPVIFDERALNQLAPIGVETGVHFWLADGSSTRSGRGRLIDHAQLVLLMHEPTEQLQG